MKKYLFILATLLTFLFFSCASEAESENEDDIIAPAVIEDTETDNASISEIEDLLPSELLPEPEDFEEPLVRDLDIKDIPSLINEDKIIEEPIIETTKTTEEIEIENQENNNQPIELNSDSVSSMQETQLQTQIETQLEAIRQEAQACTQQIGNGIKNQVSSFGLQG